MVTNHNVNNYYWMSWYTQNNVEPTEEELLRRQEAHIAFIGRLREVYDDFSMLMSDAGPYVLDDTDYDILLRAEKAIGEVANWPSPVTPPLVPK